MNSKTLSNREAWDAIAKTHYENYHIEKLLSGEPLLCDLIKSEVGDVQGKSLIHLLCHIGTDTLSWGLLGAQVTGVDISPESIHYAQKIASQMGLEATFVISDVMDLMGQIHGTYDIVFASTGVLCWIPDIGKCAATVRQLLKPGGFFYLHDGHPFRTMIDEAQPGAKCIQKDYFYSEVWEDDNFSDYTSDVAFPAKTYEWGWTLGEVVTAFCQAGLRIAFLHEFPQYFYSGYDGYASGTGKIELYPCTFSLKAIAEGQ